MTCIDEVAHRGDWCKAPPLVSVELMPPVFWLDPADVVEVLVDVEFQLMGYHRWLSSPDLRQLW
jgi:hypothetical protein